MIDTIFRSFRKRVIFILIVSLCCLAQTACAKDMYYEACVTDQLDTILHNNSKYIAVFGDIQNYITIPAYTPYYENSLNWVSAHSFHIPFIMHTGDVTNYNTLTEWETFQNTTQPYSEVVPFYTCIGNHDYLSSAVNPWGERDSTYFNEYVGFSSTISHINAYYEPNKFENVLVQEELFENDPVYLLILEMEPRRGVIRWADSLVKTIPDEHVILITHMHVTKNGNRFQTLRYMTDEESTPAQYVWDSLVYQNDNIRCVLCGHVGSLSRVLYSENAMGRIVPQIEFNIQNLQYGGCGVIELWEFDNTENVHVRVFNTYTQSFVNDSITEFQFKFR